MVSTEVSVWWFLLCVVGAGIVLALVDACLRRPLLALCVSGFFYVAFRFLFDVPMYGSHWLTDAASGRSDLRQGLVNTSSLWVVSQDSQGWKSAVLWLSQSFSVAVWLSFVFVHLSALQRQKTGAVGVIS